MVRIDIVTDGENFNRQQFMQCFENRSIVYMKNNKMLYDSNGDNIEYFISEYTASEKYLLCGNIILFCCSNVNDINVKKDSVLLFDSTELNNYNSLPCGNAVITCGTGEKNTVSLSGINEDSMALNIAREIFGLEIQEVIIKTGKPIISIYTAIFAFTVLLLTNKEALPCVRDTKAI